jgi:hypothetical protein
VAEAEEPIGSLAQETAKLLRAIAAERLKVADDAAPQEGPHVGAHAAPGETRSQDPSVEHVCTTGWCPICQVVGYVQEHPELVEQITDVVTDAALQIGRAVRDFLDKTMPPEDK